MAKAESAQREAEEHALAATAARREVEALKQQLARTRQELSSARMRHGHAGAFSSRPLTAAGTLRSPWANVQQGQQNVLRRSASVSPTRAAMMSPQRRPQSANAGGQFVLAGARMGLGSLAGSPRLPPQQQRQVRGVNLVHYNAGCCVMPVCHEGPDMMVPCTASSTHALLPIDVFGTDLIQWDRIPCLQTVMHSVGVPPDQVSTM